MELTDFLQLKKSEGYCIVGVEQTANSQSLQDYQFPEKTLLLLGYDSTLNTLSHSQVKSVSALTSTQPVVDKRMRASVFPCPCDSPIDKGVSWRGYLMFSHRFGVFPCGACASPLHGVPVGACWPVIGSPRGGESAGNEFHKPIQAVWWEQQKNLNLHLVQFESRCFPVAFISCVDGTQKTFIIKPFAATQKRT